MNRQQLVWLFLSLSGSSAHMIPGINWRNLIYLISLSPVLYLISYFSGLSFYWNQSSLRSYWDRSHLDLYLSSLNFSLGFYWDQGKPSCGGGGSSLTSSLPSLGPQVRGQSRRQEGAKGFTPKSIPLGQKSGIFHREKQGNTYTISTHFPCFLQNWSNCKTVLYLRPSNHSLSSSGYCSHAVSHGKTRCVFFKSRGSNLSQFFRIQFKGVRLELLAPICKREKKRPASSFYRRHPSLSRWGCRQTLH